MTFIKNFLKDEDGASAVEYAVLVAMIAGTLGVLASFFDFNTLFSTADTKVQGAVTNAGK